MKFLGLDIGEKRVGYAVSDAGGQIAFPRGMLLRTPREPFFATLSKVVKDEGIGMIVCGIPLGEENEETPFALGIRRFGEEVSRLCRRPIVFVDEFQTSNEALAKIPFRRDRHREKGHRDAIAAQIILQRYLDSESL